MGTRRTCGHRTAAEQQDVARPPRAPGEATTVAERVAALQRAAGNRATTGLLQRFTRVPLPSQNTTELLAQERFPDAGSGKATSYLRKEKINVVAKTTGNVLVSENARMAIEETNLAERQAKEFFADPALIDESNKKLTEVGSHYLLDAADSKQLVVPFGKATKTLSQVVPKRVSTGMSAGRKSGQRTDPVDVAATCDLVAGSIAGEIQNLPTRLKDVDLEELGITRAKDGEYRIAAFVLAFIDAPGNDDAAKRKAARAALEADVAPDKIEEIAKRYGSIPKDVARKAALGAVAAHLGLNEHATARVGEVLATISLGQPGDDKKFEDYATGKKKSVSEGEIWATHFGAVVAKDGEDVMTLQNYARHAEAKKVPGSEGEQTPGDDPRWYFQMYGPRLQKGGTADDQSWHAAWTAAARGFVNPISFVIGVGATPAGFTQDADATIRHGVAIGALSDNDADMYRARQHYLLTTDEQNALLEFRGPKAGFFRQAVNIVGVMDRPSLIRLRIQAAKVAVIRAVFVFGFQKAKERKVELEHLNVSSFHPSQDPDDANSNLGSRLIAMGIPAAYVKDTLKLDPAT